MEKTTQDIESSAEVATRASGETLIQVLLVDDDDRFLETAKQCLEVQGGFSVETVSSVVKARGELKTEVYDVIVCDYKIPITNGLEFLNALRDTGNNIPFIIFTGCRDRDICIKAFSLGADGFIEKLGNPEKVYSRLRSCIKKIINSKEKTENGRKLQS